MPGRGVVDVGVVVVVVVVVLCVVGVNAARPPPPPSSSSSSSSRAKAAGNSAHNDASRKAATVPGGNRYVVFKSDPNAPLGKLSHANRDTAVGSGGLGGVDPSSLTHRSHCNDARCLKHDDCDLGLCCNERCVAEPSYIAAGVGAACDVDDRCSQCPPPSTCVDGVCTHVVAARTLGCDCTHDSQCGLGAAPHGAAAAFAHARAHRLATGRAAAAVGDVGGFGVCRRGRCVAAHLSAGSRCEFDAQCASNSCTGTVCRGLRVGDRCDPHRGPGACAWGMRCRRDVGGSLHTCSRATVGALCSRSVDCDSTLVCHGGRCEKPFTGRAGDVCTRDRERFCALGLECFDHQCAVTTGAPCRAGTCTPDLHECACTEQGGTTCQQVAPLCARERDTLDRCVALRRCASPFVEGILVFPPPAECAHALCTQALIDYACCHSCSSIEQRKQLARYPGLDCLTRRYVTPQCCASGDRGCAPRTCNNAPYVFATLPTSRGGGAERSERLRERRRARARRLEFDEGADVLPSGGDVAAEKKKKQFPGATSSPPSSSPPSSSPSSSPPTRKRQRHDEL